MFKRDLLLKRLLDRDNGHGHCFWADPEGPISVYRGREVGVEGALCYLFKGVDGGHVLCIAEGHNMSITVQADKDSLWTTRQRQSGANLSRAGTVFTPIGQTHCPKPRLWLNGNHALSGHALFCHPKGPGPEAAHLHLPGVGARAEAWSAKDPQHTVKALRVVR